MSFQKEKSWLAKLVYGLVALLCLYAASRLMLMGSGFYARPEWRDIVLLSLLILMFNSSRKLFYWLLLPFVCVYAVYTPVGLTFGAPSYQYIASVFATDLSESREFLSQLPLVNYAAALAIILCLLLFRQCTQRGGIFLHKNKVFLAAITVFVLFPQAPFKFVRESYQAGLQVKNELQRLNNMTIASRWGQSALNEDSRYEDYVLVIGESARKDYHHAYGYETENTPFMSTAPVTLVDGLHAGGTNTIASLKLMLTKPDTQTWEGDYSLNLIDLVKSAGIKTYWISNQGYMGQFDTPISAIANKSDEKIFLKSGDSFNGNISDFELLPKFAQVLEQPVRHKRFIVLHLYGSHPISCDRLTDYAKIFNDYEIDKKYFNVNCYISSIKKTDEMLQRVYELLLKNQAKKHRSFSMIYFSDHGLAHQITEDSIAIHNSSGKSKRHYDVPLFKISSDSSKREVDRVFKSGLNFTDAIGKWVGIRNPRLNPQADLFNHQPDPDDYGLRQRIEQMQVADDPAVVIPHAK
ncbi:phosphoethanolamine transferase [Mesocricetibacter intestinalis]|uniref:phosphoethanolamine transferase n=1 Tax=Mesocricetibacter intestinalis TaxID=1521930 RepID=UPI001FB79EFD|nr:phosphoethanolamine transferase [Mesocricetibacter intestinalis]